MLSALESLPPNLLGKAFGLLEPQFPHLASD
jgi:hypothetical protein